MYQHLTKEKFPVAENISLRGINLPSYPYLTEEDVKFIASKIIEFLHPNKTAR
jgi:perosamine synthetase